MFKCARGGMNELLITCVCMLHIVDLHCMVILCMGHDALWCTVASVLGRCYVCLLDNCVLYIYATCACIGCP